MSDPQAFTLHILSLLYFPIPLKRPMTRAHLYAKLGCSSPGTTGILEIGSWILPHCGKMPHVLEGV